MTIRQIESWQISAMRTAKRNDLELRTKLSLAKDIALWEIARQLAILNARLRMGDAGSGRRKEKKR